MGTSKFYQWFAICKIAHFFMCREDKYLTIHNHFSELAANCP